MEIIVRISFAPEIQKMIKDLKMEKSIQVMRVFTVLVLFPSMLI